MEWRRRRYDDDDNDNDNDDDDDDEVPKSDILGTRHIVRKSENMKAQNFYQEKWRYMYRKL